MFRSTAARATALLALSVPIGAISGVAAWSLFESLDTATAWRLEHPWLVWLLPLAALGLGAAYHFAGGTANRGTALVVDAVVPSDDGPRIPYRMAPMIFGATFVAQLTGASVGREGAALQIGGSLTALATRSLRLSADDRRLTIVAALAGSFGGAFGVPFAGAVFGVEVRRTGRARFAAIPPALIASLTADRVVEYLGRRTPMIDLLDQLGLELDWWMILRLAVVGIVAGVAARAFVTLLGSVKHAAKRSIAWAPARPVVGAFATLALMLLFGRDYLGLSLPLVDAALTGPHADWWDPVLKLVFTAVALGCSIPGGEVTPLFVVGATLGSVLAPPLGLPSGFAAAAGLSAVYGAAARVPIACAVLTVELFGPGMALPAVMVGLAAAATAPRNGVYDETPPSKCS